MMPLIGLLLYLFAWVTLILSLPLPWYAQVALGFIVLWHNVE